MHIPGLRLLMRGLEQGPEMYVSTDWYPCEGSKDHTLRTWSADEAYPRTEGLEATDVVHRLKPLIRLRAGS